MMLQAAILGLVVGVSVLLVYASVTLLGIATHATAQRAEQERLLDLLVECTTAPEEREPPATPAPRDCYVQEQERVGKAVGTINEVVIVAASCGADHPGDLAATRRCVEAALGRG